MLTYNLFFASKTFKGEGVEVLKYMDIVMFYLYTGNFISAHFRFLIQALKPVKTT